MIPFPKDCLVKRLSCDLDPVLWLWRALGPRGFRQFQKCYGGGQIWIPKPPTLLPCSRCPRRKEHAKALRRKGETAVYISRRFGISLKHTYALLNGNGG